MMGGVPAGQQGVAHGLFPETEGSKGTWQGRHGTSFTLELVGKGQPLTHVGQVVGLTAGAQAFNAPHGSVLHLAEEY